MRKQKFLATLLAVVMLFTLVPVMSVSADEADVNTTSSDNDALTLTKNTVLQDDGTYTITLEAYSTGTVTMTTITKDLPLDIVLVLDQSGSMAEDFGSDGSRQSAMIEAVNSFIRQVGERYSDECDSRIAIVTFAENSSVLKGFTYADSSGVTELTTAVSKLVNPDGGTYIDEGLQSAYDLLSQDTMTGERGRVVVAFTDGYPGTGNWGGSLVGDIYVADNAIEIAAKLKAAKTDSNLGGGATVYTVGIFDNASAESVPDYSSVNIFSSSAEKLAQANRFLHAVSSNFPTAESRETLNAQNSKGLKYYLTAATKNKLLEAFTTISSDLETSSTTTTLGTESVMKDILSDNFVLPEGYSASSSVKLQVQAGTSSNGVINWGDISDAPATVTAAADIETGTINVTGFDYKEQYISDAHPGQKLIVTISGVELDPTKFVAGSVATNDSASGIYTKDNEEGVLVKGFTVPTIKLASKSYVIDYAKSFDISSTEWPITATHIAGNTHAFETASKATSIDLPNGKVESKDGTTYTYTPQTTSWNGYDSFYAFGSDSNNEKLWSSVNVIPANNIYYEDTFETDGADTVGIEYTGSWTKDTDASTSNTSESVNTETHGGWQNANLADDAGYSDGTAHTVNVSVGSQATATFKFTGTGFDVYSRTNSLTGTVVVIVRDEGGNYVKGFSIDTVSRSDEYDGVPTLSVLDLEHGTYNVTIYVTSAADTEESGNRATYYIDGIRIYNPLGNDLDTTVSTAYGDEINASFKEVRDILLDANSFGEGATGVVFIDQADPADPSSSGDYTIGTYETYGPENEVYLAAGQSIVFAVANTEATYHVGFRSPTGADVTVEYSAGTDAKESKTINHTTDLYYKVTPNTDGTITITNTSGALLSVTKIRTSGAAASQGLMLLSMTEDEALDTVAAFSLMRVVDTEEEPVDPETPSTDPDDSQDTTEEPEEPEIDIVNPEPENKPEIEEVKNELNKLVTNLFKNIFKWFGRR